MARSKCKIDGCDRNAHGHGWCLPHYNKWRKYGDPLVVKRLQRQRGMPIVDRFWSFVDDSDPDACWEWTGACFPYGRFTLPAPPHSRHRSVQVSAHRFAYELTHGPITGESKIVCHRCDNPPCVNPAHLFLGTQSDNIRDMYRKGREGRNQPKGTAHVRAKLTVAQVREIRRRGDAGETAGQIHAEYGVAEQTVRSIIQRRNWRSIA